MNNKKTLVNLVATMIAFFINIFITFFLSPYIIKQIGVEAYGFFSLSNNFVMYFSVVTGSINAIAGRYIVIALHKKKIYEANQYYTSMCFANVILSLVLLVSIIIGVLNLEYFLTIPEDILIDIKLLFFTVFLSFLLNMFSSILAVSYIVKNELYLSSLIQIKGNLIRLIGLLALFYFYPPYVSYLGITSLISTIFTRCYDLYYKKILVPMLNLKKEYVSLKKIKEMFSSGSWNMVLQLGAVLSGNIDLLVINLYLGATDMGILAIAKMLPIFLYNISSTMSGVFMPNFLELYAKNKYDELVSEVKKSLKLVFFIFSIPLAIFLVLGKEFFSLWVPNQNAEYIYILSILSTVSVIIIGPIMSIVYNIFTVVNKLKINALLVLITGAINTVICLLILNYTSMGLLVIVSVTSALSLIRNLLYNVPYGAIYLKSKWHTFFPIIIKATLGMLLIFTVGYKFKQLFNIDSWINFICIAIFIAMVDIFIQLSLILSKDERFILLNKIKTKIGKKI